MNWMMLCKLPLGASLWAILFFFIFTACQDDAPYEDTEVMVTFTTRAELSNVVNSTAPENERMQDLRVIMVRNADGLVVDNHLEKSINASSITFTFSTPIKMGGEEFTFLAIANEESIIPSEEGSLDWIKRSKLSAITNEELTAIKKLQIGNKNSFNINDGPIPQTKQWTIRVPSASNQELGTKQLDFVASKISVQFKNETNASQTLTDVNITGILPNGYGYLFVQDQNDYVQQDVSLNKISFANEITIDKDVTSNPLDYYTYPIDATNINNPTLHASWKGQNYTLPIAEIINEQEIKHAFTSLKRNDHLKILITLTGQELVVNYTIAPWNADNATNIGSPTTNGDYQVGDWGNGNDIIIGGEIGGGEEPEPEPEPDAPVVPEGVIELWNNDEGLVLTNEGQGIQLDSSKVDYITAGKTLKFYYTFVSNAPWYKIELQCNEGKKIIVSDLEYTSEASSKSVLLTEETAEHLKLGIELNDVKFWGLGISVTSICLE